MLEQKRLIESIHPFELLSSRELNNLMAKVDIAYYPKETSLFSPTKKSHSLFIVIKGIVHELQEDVVHNLYIEGDSFDADALLYEKVESSFVVVEDLICYEIKRDDFLELLQNKKVQNYFLQNFISRHQHLKEYAVQNDLTPFLMAKVSDIFLHNFSLIDADSSIKSGLENQKKLQSKVIITEYNNSYFIVTDSDLKEKILLQGIDIESSIKTIALNKIIDIDRDDFLFNALLMMTHHEIKQLIVTDEKGIVGVLTQIDLLSYFANHSHLIAVQIEKAQDIEELKNLQKDLKNLIVTLKIQGVKHRYITKLVATLNSKIYKKVFEFCVEKGLRENCCLIVMGSEGREEQSIKTDQDNALIIQDGVDRELFKVSMLKLNRYLLEIGFPKCKGDVMVSNPFYRQNIGDYKKLITNYSESLDAQNLQELSILLDAKYVGGDRKLFDNFQHFIHKSFYNRDDVLAHLAKVILSFETPLSFFSKFIDKERIDLKKGGIFSLVHGVRVLALKYQIESTNTIERVKELNNRAIIDKNFATELIESFDTLSSLRLDGLLESNSNAINSQKLTKHNRDLLKDSLKIVNKFKKFITFHFHLEIVT